MVARLREIRRFPVKGLAGQVLASTTLQPSSRLAHDRRYAITHAGSSVDPNRPAWAPKRQFAQLFANERLAQLGIGYEEEGGLLTILRDGKRVARGALETPIGRDLVGQFMSAFLGRDLPGPARIVRAEAGGFTDVEEPYVSLINLASVADIERVARSPLDPRRFRGNLMIEGLPAWEEFNWVGRTIKVGAATIEITERIGRCAATSVNPESAIRDVNVPKTLLTGFGHSQCGVYGIVVEGATIAPGDEMG